MARDTWMFHIKLAETADSAGDLCERECSSIECIKERKLRIRATKARERFCCATVICIKLIRRTGGWMRWWKTALSCTVICFKSRIYHDSKIPRSISGILMMSSVAQAVISLLCFIVFLLKFYVILTYTKKYIYYTEKYSPKENSDINIFKFSLDKLKWSIYIRLHMLLQSTLIIRV